MSETNNRPIYVKKQKRASKRRRQPERLHGAFSGGFSAGHFNTVGSKNGWKPPDADADADADADTDAEGIEEEQQNEEFGLYYSSKKKKKGRSVQRLEDFMDEEDANEWGGPVKVKEVYQRRILSESETNENKKIGVFNRKQA